MSTDDEVECRALAMSVTATNAVALSAPLMSDPSSVAIRKSPR